MYFLFNNSNSEYYIIYTYASWLMFMYLDKYLNKYISIEHVLIMFQMSSCESHTVTGSLDRK